VRLFVRRFIDEAASVLLHFSSTPMDRTDTVS
jgi:hypothetical protein